MTARVAPAQRRTLCLHDRRRVLRHRLLAHERRWYAPWLRRPSAARIVAEESGEALLRGIVAVRKAALNPEIMAWDVCVLERIL